MEEFFIGQHEVRFEGEDVMILRIRGAILPGQMKQLAELHDVRLLQHGRLFVLCDVGRADPPSYSSRQELTSRPKKLPPHWIAYVGMPKEFVTILDLIVRAVKVLTSSKITHRYFQDEPAARAWLDEIKKKAGFTE